MLQNLSIFIHIFNYMNYIHKIFFVCFLLLLINLEIISAGHKIYIEHVKFSKCNKSHGINRFVNDLLVSLVGNTNYLRSNSFSGNK